ncbi:MAG: quinone-dependent dihydroorotate dehydrogenase [Spirulina sp. SIO3F2]|nr:quinone-dependent dihydroorotate dehydrogenase [Spirulina sp. SIO3F2]
MNLYKAALRPLLFGSKADPEWLHNRSLAVLAWLDRTQPTAFFPGLEQAYCFQDSRLSQTLWGQTFANPVGLAAGFDKNGVAAGSWPRLGFGFAEVGTVTAHAQLGNPKPRLFRLGADGAALNRMGFNNQGSAALQACLHQRYQRLGSMSAPLGINLGKSKITPLEQAAQDYQTSFERLRDWGDYFVVNVSSPNTPGLRSLQDRAQLTQILTALNQVNPQAKPILVKIAPDLSDRAICELVDLAREQNVAGLIATNTTIQRQGLKTQFAGGEPIATAAGGISGRPVRSRSTEVIRLIWQQSQGQLPIIGVGGIFSAADAWEKIMAGASLVQVYTGWIYEGPGLVKAILQGLIEQLDAHNLPNIQAAVGLSHP